MFKKNHTWQTMVKIHKCQYLLKGPTIKLIKCDSSSVSAEGYDVSDRCDPQGVRAPGLAVRAPVISRRLCGAEIRSRNSAD